MESISLMGGRMQKPSVILTLLTVLLVSVSASSSAHGQTGAARETSLTQLSMIFGELHHIRRSCEGGPEAQVWRDRMRRLIKLEDPTATQRERMARAFNDGFSNAQRRFPRCSRAANDFAAARAVRGATLVERLRAPLQG
ncbi:MAG: TIGR02301 family protein [Pseudomonadota bacterium]